MSKMFLAAAAAAAMIVPVLTAGPAEAKWVTYTGQYCTHRGFPSPCEFWVPIKVAPNPNLKPRDLVKFTVDQAAKEKQECASVGGQWLKAGTEEACARKAAARVAGPAR